MINDFTELFWNETVARCLVSLNGFTWLFKGEEVVLTFGKVGKKSEPATQSPDEGSVNTCLRGRP